MTPDVSPPDLAALGAALAARREAKGMTRPDVVAAGGPSEATIMRTEQGRLKRGLSPKTKKLFEQALELPDGWINDFLSRRPEVTGSEGAMVAIDGNGERILVAIAEGVSELSIEERQAVLAVVRALRKGSTT
jgi:transcriptional regulator with XRE-family HTH domain